MQTTEHRFRPTLTYAEFQNNILQCFLTLGKQMAWMGLEPKKIWAALNVDTTHFSHGHNPGSILDPSLKFNEYEIAEYFNFDTIKHTEFATGLQDLYALAFHGRYYPGSEYGQDEAFTRINDLLELYATSQLSEQIDGFGGRARSEARELQNVLYLADARLILEGITTHTFCRAIHFDDQLVINHARELTSAPHRAGELTIKQLAALSMMTPESIRAAANPKRGNALVTMKSPFDGTTVIDIAEARRWLDSKGMRVPMMATQESNLFPKPSLKNADTPGKFHSVLLQLWEESGKSGSPPDLQEMLVLCADPQALTSLGQELCPEQSSVFIKKGLQAGSQLLLELSKRLGE
jgi:hypothetical protein